jgi:hypothetical protein
MVDVCVFSKLGRLVERVFRGVFSLNGLERKFDNETFQEFLRRKSEKVKGLPPILGLRREDEKAFNVL